MKHAFRTYSLTAIVLLSAGGLASGLAPGSAAVTRGHEQPLGAVARTYEPGPPLAALARHLRKRGFHVNPGYPMLWAKGACETYLYPAFETCFGNNPVSPYVIPVVKAWPNEQVGPSPPDAFGKVRSGYTPFFRLNPREAIVFYGEMPPPAKFMGLQTVVWSQPGRWKAEDYDKWAQTAARPYPMEYLFATIPPNDPRARRTLSFSSLGDAVNNPVMQRRSGAPWGKTRYVITTPSATTDRAIRRALHAQGVSDDAIFTERVPRRDRLGPIGPLGMGKNAIEFWSFFRYAIPDDPAAAQRWWADLPLTVLRVRGAASLGPVRRYDLATYGERTAHSEAHLAGDLRALFQAVCDRISGATDLESADCSEPASASSLVADPAHDYGWNAAYCRKVHMWCGDQSDAGLLWTGPLPLDSGQVYAMVDALATETGNATYVGLGVNDASTFLSPTGVTDATLKGSAQGYGPTVENADKFFVHYFTRNCGVLEPLLAGERLARDCTPITADMLPTFGHPALRGMFWPGLREYILPGSDHGPDTSKLLRPRILTFTRP